VDYHIDLSTLAKQEIRDLPAYIRAQARQLICLWRGEFVFCPRTAGPTLAASAGFTFER